jgi:dTDP-L-rhamnose 4-epimerase
MNVVITGGAGFIGSRLAHRLHGEGAAVTVLDNLSVQVHGADADFDPELARVATCIRGDVRDRAVMSDLVADKEVIVHLAAETGTGQSMYAVEHYADVNVQGTAVLLDLLVNARPAALRKIIVASSRAVYGEGQYRCTEHGTVFPHARTEAAMSSGQFEAVCPHCHRVAELMATTEATPYGPSSFYGLTKQVQEQMVLMFASALGIDGFGLRYQNVYGPGQSLTNPYTGILAVFSNLVRQGKPLNIFEDGEESRDFVFVDDVVEATAACIRPDVHGVTALNVGSGHRTTVMEVAQAVIAHFGADVPVNISGAYRVGDIRHNVADISAIRALTGFDPKWGFAEGRDETGIDGSPAYAPMKLASVVRLAQGLTVQIICYFGLFLSLAVGARALSPADFGIYASAVAVASFAGSVMTAGLDRIILRVMLQLKSGAQGGLDQALFVPVVLVNIVALAAVAAVVATGWAGWPLLFIAVMATLVAARLILSGWFKFVANNHANVIATFGVQPLCIGLIFGALLLSEGGRTAARDPRLWVIATLVVEVLQILVLYVIARSSGFRIDHNARPQMMRGAVPHARAGLLISLLALFAQTGPFGIAIAQWLFSPVDQGVYTVAVRVSQLILFPLIGAWQLVIPLSSKTYEPCEIDRARNEIRTILVSTNALMFVSNIAFMLIGSLLLSLVMNVTDPRAYVCTFILNVGNLIVGIFGVGDQVLVGHGRHRQGFWISVWCGGVVFPILVAVTVALGWSILGLAASTAFAMALRAVVGHHFARKLVAIPVAVFDRN